MPPWGRPLGSRTRRGRDERYREQRRRWEDHTRFEELETDEDEGSVESWDADVHPRRSASDELYFTGVDLGGRRRVNRQITYGDEASTDSSDTNSDERDRDGARIALRDKETRLAQTAVERIRRAQRLGEPDVHLSKSEYEALERERLRTGPSPQNAPRRAAPSRGATERRPRHERDGPSRHVARSDAPAKPIYDPEYSPYLHGVGPAGQLNYGMDYTTPYPQLECRPPRRKQSSASLSRPSSSRSSQPHTPPSPAQRDARTQARYFSLPETRQVPGRTSAGHTRNRSRSTAHTPPLVDPMQYQTYLSTLSYGPDSRRPADPVNVGYGPIQRRHLPPQSYPYDPRGLVTSSDPALARRYATAPGSTPEADEPMPDAPSTPEDDEDDDDYRHHLNSSHRDYDVGYDAPTLSSPRKQNSTAGPAPAPPPRPTPALAPARAPVQARYPRRNRT